MNIIIRIGETQLHIHTLGTGRMAYQCYFLHNKAITFNKFILFHTTSSGELFQYYQIN